MVVKNGVDYDSLDGQPVQLIFMIAAPEGGANEHLEALSKLSTMLMNPDFKENLLKAKTKEEFLQVIAEKETLTDEKKTEKRSKNFILYLTSSAFVSPISTNLL